MSEAPSRSSICSNVRGPTIGATTPGTPSSHASATCEIVAPLRLRDRLRLVDDAGSCARSRAGGAPPRCRRPLRPSASPPAGRCRASTSPSGSRRPAAPTGSGRSRRRDRTAGSRPRSSADERVLRLQQDERRPAVAVLQRDRPGEQPRRVVGGADRAHLAGAHEPVERLQRLLERRRRDRARAPGRGRSRRSPSRFRLASQAARTRSGASPSPGGSETFMRTLVATTTSSRREASHGASVRSDSPSP